MSTIGKELFKSLRLKYVSEIQSNRSTLLIYLNNSVGIGEHPEHIDEMDKLVTKMVEAHDKLDYLMEEFPNELYK